MATLKRRNEVSSWNQKILSDNTIAVTATVQSVPIVGGHSEAINVGLLMTSM
jgi:aspartate-semialdehyde dehydrogenase